MKQLGYLILLWSFQLNAQSFNTHCSLPPSLLESSGLEIDAQGYFWTHNDSGNEAVIYQLDDQCQIIRLIYLNDVQNNDWEDLALGEDGMLYVGDFGNNNNSRTDLAIYFFNINGLPIGESTITPQQIHFSFSEQAAFPPPDTEMNFDTEAMVVKGDSLYLFTKNRTSPYTGKTYQYSLPTIEGTYALSRNDSFYVASLDYVSSVTAADYYESTQQLVLMTSSEILLFQTNNQLSLLHQPIDRFSFTNITQKEGIAFADSCHWFLTDEHNIDLQNGGLLSEWNNCISNGYEVKPLDGITLYPQPADLSIRISAEAFKNSIAKVLISTISGEVLLNEMYKIPCTLNVNNWPSGSYILQLEAKSNHFVKKFEIAH